MPSFTDFGLLEPICRTLDERFFPIPTIIQLRAIPPLLEGKDLLAIAPVGAGKTAAYLLPMLHRLADPPVPAGAKEPRAMVLTAARERAEAISRAIGGFGRFVPVRHIAAADAGTWNKQSKELRTGVEVVVTTPKQLVQLLRERQLSLRALEILIVDDADEMLTQGMSADLERIEQELPEGRQTAFFVAVADEMLRNVARMWMRDPVEVEAPALKKKKKSSGETEQPVDLPEWLTEKRPPVELPDWLAESDGAQDKPKSKGKSKAAAKPKEKDKEKEKPAPAPAPKTEPEAKKPKAKPKPPAAETGKPKPKPKAKDELPGWLDEDDAAGKPASKGKGKPAPKKNTGKKS